MRPEELQVTGIEVEHRYADAGGLRMHYAEAGSGDPVVLLHGWPQHWWIWRGVIPSLVAAGRRVICPDLRGMGWSDAPPSGYEKEQFAADVLALLDTLGVERFALAGHDWGGFAGFLICLREPERVERFLALSIVHPWIERDPSPVELLKALGSASYQYVLATPGVGGQVVSRTPFIETILRLGAGEGFEWPAGAREAYTDRFGEPARARATSALYRTFLLRELAPLLRGRYHGRRLTVPTLLLHGAEDRVVTAKRLGESWRAHADDMRVEQVPGGHFLPDEQPELIAQRAVEQLAPSRAD